MNGRIALTGLRARGFHGVFDFEREQGQDFVVDVLLELDLAKAAATDDVADTVHYGELAERLVAVITGEPVNLIETLADRLLADPDGNPRPVGEREAATLATSVLAVAAGAWGVRVHDVRGTPDALAVWRASGAPHLSKR